MAVPDDASPALQTSEEVTGDPYFLVLCSAARRAAYDRYLAACGGYQASYVDSVEKVLMTALEQPPLALLADVPTITRLGSDVINPLFHLGVAWPAFRVMLRPDGSADLMCHAPLRLGALDDALRDIAAGDPRWRHPRHSRRHLRMEIECRVRMRKPGQPAWHPGNTLNVGSGGAFIISYDDFRLGEQIEMDILDLLDKPLRLAAVVASVRAWEQSRRLPGIGVSFLPPGPGLPLRRAIGRPEYISSLQRQLTPSP